jgi:hypothetical protein
MLDVLEEEEKMRRHFVIITAVVQHVFYRRQNSKATVEIETNEELRSDVALSTEYKTTFKSS